MRLAYIVILINAVFLLSSCIGSKPLTQRAPEEPATSFPAKQVPPSGKIPPTQRPYKIDGKKYYPLPSSQGYAETGIASWYGKQFHGRLTSNGERYDMHGMTAAHKTLPMHTWLVVKNLENDKEIVVRINDRGPFVKGRIVDLTLTGAKKLEMDQQGTARVEILALGETGEFQQGNRKVERFLPHQDFAKGEFYVQIGSFESLDNAERQKEQLLSWGRKTVIQVFDNGEKTFYRVQVRAGTNLSEARRAERVLERSGFSGAFVVAR
ncbi:MAG: septal ring lytic transglycosylase RlpA family protein [Proteobacteria bacterium]|nr:septal ring lytic transglycosylase RlpA family protein [Pseudomonadota bacterium]MBU1710020.1 septal ring lytic transglycosylase RlpA family protein [Pseudomonadota bacterium]